MSSYKLSYLTAQIKETLKNPCWLKTTGNAYALCICSPSSGSTDSSQWLILIAASIAAGSSIKSCPAIFQGGLIRRNPENRKQGHIQQTLHQRTENRAYDTDAQGTRGALKIQRLFQSQRCGGDHPDRNSQQYNRAQMRHEKIAPGKVSLVKKNPTCEPSQRRM
jgi:hypothetical protein